MTAIKACPIILRSRHDIVHILAFKHPAAGYQLVKGTIERDESPSEAAIRELCEESGICDAHVVADLGLWNASYQEQIWSFRLCESGAEFPDAWTFETSDDGGHMFEFYWQPLQWDLPEQCHPLFQSALREARRRIEALTRSV
ncbi:MutT/NUDIX family hydrolase [Cupriavidus basilensis OR16]|uniref:MutT/NUDIX family hydrolase n=1 Tax=Cupriavidus basilensis OR16 TaxID=1127483 RepID=H1S770_9BURK|nr:NUDIX domain-containing protein [Cupriavidus basilensis]EHP41595.1 MutT/NUDIX family hydrolase [Cupriavidus basilensis OR16]